MNERFKKLMLHYNMSPSHFADEIGVNRPGISHIISGRNKPGVELIQKVLKRFPEVSTDWLLMGTGSMLHSTISQEKIESSIAETKQEIKGNNSLQNSLFPEEDLPDNKTNKDTGVRTGKTDSGLKIQASEKIKRITVYYNDGSFEDFIKDV